MCMTEVKHQAVPARSSRLGEPYISATERDQNLKQKPKFVRVYKFEDINFSNDQANLENMKSIHMKKIAKHLK